jgi:YD repeat-containing protein
MTFSNFRFIKKSEILHITLSLIIVLSFSLYTTIICQTKKSAVKKKFEIVDQEQREFDKVKGLKVKSRIKNVAFYNKQGKLPAKLAIAEKIIFDKKGNRKILTKYKGQGMLDFKYKYSFNSKGNLIETATFDSMEKIATKRISKYDKKGNELERRMINFTHNSGNRAVFSYDADGNLVRTNNYDEKGGLISEIIMIYKDGLTVNALTKTAKGDTSQYITNTFDSFGRVVKEEHSGREGKFEITFKYDENGNVTEINNPSYRRTYEYDENSNLIEDKMYLPTGARQFRVQFSYYPNGLLKEEVRYDTNDKPAFSGTYVYEFYK